ncbi:cupin-like domain-containing protein [uncultured Sphingomonas sp.]|uniref:cupin-like domain-containing protein n=1 Tax=uncultured Sphingomonas sp. TaxID=158754 RepID=UPI0035CA674C
MAGLAATETTIPHVPVLTGVTRARFEQEIVPAGRPVMLRGLVASWPIVAAASRSDEALAGYLVARPATQPVNTWFIEPALRGRFGYAQDMRGFNHERRVVPIADLLDYLIEHRGDAAAFTAYAGGIPITSTLPGLRDDLPMPLLDQARDMLVSLWLGGQAHTAAHWDVPQNLACVVAGRRRFTLFPTDQVQNLYIGPLDHTLAGQPTSLVDVAAPDFDRFPRFRDALATAELAELSPGDALYLPSLWWHHVESLDPVGAMINFWWRDGPDWMITPLFTLFHALLTLRDLPENERAAWRTFFDHYIFQRNGDPMAHLPPDARGVFGDLTADVRQRLKAFLIGPLQP